jgi:hypothetical protein
MPAGFNRPFQQGQAFQGNPFFDQFFQGSSSRGRGGQRGGLAGQINPDTQGGAIMGLALEDYDRTNQALQFNFMRGLGQEQRWEDFLGGLSADQAAFEQNLRGTTERTAEGVVGLADEQAQAFQDYMGDSPGDVKGYLDKGIGGFEQDIEEYGQNQAANWAAQASGIQRSVDNNLTRLMSDPNMDPAEKQFAAANIRFQGMRASQEAIAPMQAQVENIRLQAQGQLAGMRLQAGQIYGGVTQGFGAQMLRSQQARQQAYQYVGSMSQAAELQIGARSLQAQQMQLAGLNALGAQIANNPLRFASQLPLGLLAANLHQAGARYSPFSGVPGMSGQRQIRDRFRDVNTGYGYWQPGQYPNDPGGGRNMQGGRFSARQFNNLYPQGY